MHPTYWKNQVTAIITRLVHLDTPRIISRMGNTRNPIVRLLINLIQPPSRRAIIMHSRPPQIPNILPLEASARRAVQHAAIVPDDHVPRIFPHDAGDVLVLRDMSHQCIQQLLRFLRRDALNMMAMGSNIQIHPPTRFMALDDAMTSHLLPGRVQVFKEFRRRDFARMRETMRADIVVF